MSIINDALKKAEQEKNKIVTDEPGYTNIASKVYKPSQEQNKNIEVAKVEPHAAKPTLDPSSETKKSNNSTWVLLAILSFVAVMSISIIMTNLKKESVKPLATLPPSVPEETLSSPDPKPTLNAGTSPISDVTLLPQTQPVETVPSSITEPQTVKIPASPPYLTLSGIVAGGDESFAIIDGAIVKKDDTISGARVVEIYSDRVVLEFDGAEFSMRTP